MKLRKAQSVAAGPCRWLKGRGALVHCATSSPPPPGALGPSSGRFEPVQVPTGKERHVTESPTPLLPGRGLSHLQEGGGPAFWVGILGNRILPLAPHRIKWESRFYVFRLRTAASDQGGKE